MSIERKYLAHYIDAKFDTTYEAPEYTRLGKDLTEYNDEMNPILESFENILGEHYTRVIGYEVQGNVETFMFEYEKALEEKIMEIANTRSTGDKCRTSVVDVLLRLVGGVPHCVWAYREDAVVVPQKIGGKDGIELPFTVYKAGNRVRGTFDLETKEFTKVPDFAVAIYNELTGELTITGSSVVYDEETGNLEITAPSVVFIELTGELVI